MAETKRKQGGIRFTVGFKLISMTSLIILISLSSIIFLASWFFREDNEIRVKENGHKLAEIIALKLQTDLYSLMEKCTLIATGLAGGQGNAQLNRMFFQNDKDVLFVGIVEQRGGKLAAVRSTYNESLVKESGLQQDDFGKVLNLEQDQFRKSFAAQQEVHNATPFFKQAVVGVSVPFQKTSESEASSILVIYMKMDRFAEAVKSPGITKAFVVNDGGDVVAHYDETMINARANLMTLPIVKMMVKSPVDNGQTRYQDEKDVVFLGSFKKIAFGDIGVITAVEEAKAFEAVYMILRRNILITIIVLSLAITVVYFFAKTLTNPVKRLVEATHQIKEGKFDIQMDVKSNDEIGELSRSFIQMGRGLAEREKMKDAMGRFVNKVIAEKAMKGELELGGERRHAAVFFSDIRSFTAISEKLEPEEVVEFLNQYMTAMVECVNATNGVVDKYIGDAIMATWGAPISTGNDTENALNAALMMRRALADFNKDRGGPRQPIIKIGCGINSGPVIAGQIGSRDKMQYTVIGDTVNLASRIEALNKPFGTDILISQESYRQICHIFATEPMQAIKVKGKSQPQQIYAVLGRKDAWDRPRNIDELRQFLGTNAAKMADFDPDAKEDKFEILGSNAKKKKAQAPQTEPPFRPPVEPKPGTGPRLGGDDQFHLSSLHSRGNLLAELGDDQFRISDVGTRQLQRGGRTEDAP